jgi:hypothetical protein
VILASVGHQRSNGFPNVGGIPATFRERLGMSDTPAQALVTTDRVRVHGHASNFTPEQARANGVPRFMDSDPHILVVSTSERSEEFVVFIDLAIEAAVVVGRASAAGIRAVWGKAPLGQPVCIFRIEHKPSSARG